MKIQQQIAPPWALMNPPDLTPYCVGVLYVAVPEPFIDTLRLDPGASDHRSWAALGPALQDVENTASAWIPYDLAARDTIEGVPAEQRAYPWNFGDIIVELFDWRGLPTLTVLQHPRCGLNAVRSWSHDVSLDEAEKEALALLQKEWGVFHLKRLEERPV